MVSERRSLNKQRLSPLRWIGLVLWLCVCLAILVQVRNRNEPLIAPLESVVLADEEQSSVKVNEDGTITLTPTDLKPTRKDKHYLPEPIPLPDCEFIERSGHKVTKQDLLGKKWAACFVFTRCAGPCPQIMGQMRLLHEELHNADVRLVTITVDPDNDTPEVLQNYANTFHADEEKWLFFTGNRDEIYKFITFGFRLAATIIEDKPIHTNRVALVNERGEYIANFQFPKETERIALRRALLGVSLRTSSGNSSDIKEKLIKQPVIPGWVEQLPLVNALLNLLATVMLIMGFVLIKQKQIAAHKICMMSCFAVSVAFLACYLLYHGQLTYYTGQGHKPFAGTGIILPIYRSILVTHVILAAAVPFFAIITIYRGLKNQVELHRKIARFTFPIWVYVSVTGIIIYILNYQWPLVQ